MPKIKVYPEYLKDLFSCHKCHDMLEPTTKFPEPFLGNIRANFAIVGINPGENESTFKNIDKYINYYYHIAKLDNKRWTKGYYEAYKRLMNQKATYKDFNDNTVILNIIKCATKKKPSKKVLDFSKNNCKLFLMKQLKQIKPKVVLVHSRFSCDFFDEFLHDGHTFRILQKSYTKKLSEISMDDISKEYLIAKDNSGRKILFLFNKHLSYYGPSMKSLEVNIDKKRRLIKKVSE